MRDVQAQVLNRVLSMAAETGFGRDHGLDRARTLADYRAAVPISPYERFQPYIDRVCHGETEAMFPPGTVLRMFALTSGTSGEAKHIPVTDAYMKAYREGWHVWGCRALQDHYDAFGAKILQISSRVDEKTAPCGLPAGAVSGLTAQGQRRVVRWMYASPTEIAYARDTAAKYYLACRLALVHRRVWPITANPSTLIGLARAMDARKEELLRDVANGTLTRDLNLAAGFRRRIESRLRPCRARARHLAAVADASGHLYPKDAWDVPLIGTWKGGTLCLYIAEIPRYWGDAPIRDVGLIASEGRFSIPLQTDGSAGVLDVPNTFYEFVPEEEIGRDEPTALLAHEVDQGQRYYIVPTTPAGLYRYHIGDVVQVTGRYGPAPMIEYLHRGESTSNLTGEKLTEHQVTTATNRAARHLGLSLGGYCVCPTWGEVPHYSLLVEEGEVPAADAPSLAAEVERALCALNIEYEAKRKSGRLEPLRVKTLPAGTWETYDRETVEVRQGRIEQYKHKFLVRDVDFVNRFAVRETYAPSGEDA